MSLLKLDNVTIRFGGLVAVDKVNLEINQGEIMALIGPNGAGKSTIFNLISGLYTPTEGNVFFKNENISKQKPHVVAAKGIARTFQNIRLFNELTVLENVLIGAHTCGKWDLIGAFLSFSRWVRREESDLKHLAMNCLKVVKLEHKAFDKAKNLPYGEQRRLEIARALASRPELLLLDEPAAGMNPQEKNQLMEIVRSIRDSGLTICLVEHDMKFVMGISDSVIVLDHGAKIAEGAPQEIHKNPRVIEAYLGKGAVH